MKRSRVRDAAAVVADLAREELPEATLRSGGTPSDPADPLAWLKLKNRERHPYRPDPVDEWLRERTGTAHLRGTP